jgi:excinuclease ABC subunit C
LGDLLGISPPRYIEAFDVSNIQGAYSVGAMVVYEDGAPARKKYRKYRIKTVSGANDTHSIYEIVTRRYRRLKEAGERFPDLVVVDGGKPQVKSAEKAIADLGLAIDVLGLGKDDRHRTSYLFFKDEEINIDRKSNTFFFLENLQDEVHRFAITFYRQTHSRAVLSSRLDGIEGIGKVRKKQILAILRDSDYENFESKLRELNLTDEQINEIKKVV